MATPKEITAIRHQLVESYLLIHGFTDILYLKDEEYICFMKRDSRSCQLMIQREWMEKQSIDTVKARLDFLGLIPFLQNHSAAWIGMKAGQEALRHIF